MTDAAEILSPSPTGVPARLRIAGVGARAYAFTVDFNIRIAIAFAWYSTGAVLHSSVNAAEVSLRRPREPDLWWTYAIEIPVVVMFILYHPIVETLLRGKPETPFLKAGDTVRIEMLDDQHHSIFGAIEQTVAGV